MIRLVLAICAALAIGSVATKGIANLAAFNEQNEVMK
jgi:hypothetical protein